MFESLLELKPEILLTFVIAFCTALTCAIAVFAYSLANRTFGFNKHADLGAIFIGREFGSNISQLENGKERKSISVTIKYRIENHSKATITIDEIKLPSFIFNFGASLIGPSPNNSANQVSFDQFGDRTEFFSAEKYGTSPEEKIYAHILRPGDTRQLNVFVSMNVKKYPKYFLSYLIKKSCLISRYSGDNKGRRVKHSLRMRSSLSLKERLELEAGGYYSENIIKRIIRFFINKHMNSYRAPSIKSGRLEKNDKI